MDVDRVKCKTMKVDLNDVFATLQVFLGGYYVNDFNRFGRTWQVNVQADAPYRINAETVKQFKVRNADGNMVPLGAVATVRDEVGPVFVLRYNMNTATAINGAVLPSVSSGTVIDSMEKLAKRELPRNMTYEWTELTFMQKEATRTESLRDLLQNPFTAFVGAVVLVFLVLAALYESWSLPLSVILVVPMCLLCAMTGVFLAVDGPEHLRAGRFRGAGRPGEQKCDPDCGICTRPAEGGAFAVRRRRWRRRGCVCGRSS